MVTLHRTVAGNNLQTNRNYPHVRTNNVWFTSWDTEIVWLLIFVRRWISLLDGSLPPAHEERGKVMFSVCLFVPGEGYPQSGCSLGQWDTPSQACYKRGAVGRYPNQSSARGYTWAGPMGTPSWIEPGQDWGTPRTGQGFTFVMRWVVRLMRSPWKTFLFKLFYCSNPYFLLTVLRIEVLRYKWMSLVYSHHCGVAFHIDHTYPNPITLASFPIETFWLHWLLCHQNQSY